jgi:hypothetical protein
MANYPAQVGNMMGMLRDRASGMIRNSRTAEQPNNRGPMTIRGKRYPRSNSAPIAGAHGLVAKRPRQPNSGGKYGNR